MAWLGLPHVSTNNPFQTQSQPSLSTLLEVLPRYMPQENIICQHTLVHIDGIGFSGALLPVACIDSYAEWREFSAGCVYSLVSFDIAATLISYFKNCRPFSWASSYP